MNKINAILSKLNEAEIRLSEGFVGISWVIDGNGKSYEVEFHGQVIRLFDDLLQKAKKIFRNERSLEKAIEVGDDKLYEILYGAGCIRVTYSTGKMWLSFTKPTYKAMTGVMVLLAEKKQTTEVCVDTVDKYEELPKEEFIRKYL